MFRIESEANSVSGFSPEKLVYQIPKRSQGKMNISGAQVKAARELLKITQPELAKASDVSESTLQAFEADKAIPKASTLQKILNELARRGIEFTNGTGIGVRLNFEKAAEFSRSAAGS